MPCLNCRYIAANSKRTGVYRHCAGWQARTTVFGKTYALGTWPTEDAACVAWDVASVWRSVQRCSRASQLYNHPQLRMWEDAALVASLRGIQSGEQLQVFVKAWAEEHLPAKLAQLA